PSASTARSAPTSASSSRPTPRRTRCRSSPASFPRTRCRPTRAAWTPLVRTRPMRPRLREIDKPLAGVVVVLVAYGLATLYSAGQTDVPTFVATIWHRQPLWLALGAAAVFFMVGLSPRLLELAAPS